MATDCTDLDHVALAAADTAPVLRFLTGRCGATTLWGGQSIGFRPMQVFVGDAGGGMKIELLEPWATEHNDFLERFVQRHKNGPHHLTFKVPDLVATIDRFRGAGYRPVNIDLRDPHWKECFLLPKEAHGTVVQLAEAAGAEFDFADVGEMLDSVRASGASGNPRWWVEPEAPEGPPLRLLRVVLRTPVLASAMGFFAGMLQGTVDRESAGRIELSWPGGAAIALEEISDAVPGIDRLEVEGLVEPIDVLGTTFAPG